MKKMIIKKKLFSLFFDKILSKNSIFFFKFDYFYKYFSNYFGTSFLNIYF